MRVSFSLFREIALDQNQKQSMHLVLWKNSTLPVDWENCPFPFGASGWAAKQIWNKVSKTPKVYYGKRNVSDQLKVLGKSGKTDDEYIKAIFEMIGILSH